MFKNENEWLLLHIFVGFDLTGGNGKEEAVKGPIERAERVTA